MPTIKEARLQRTQLSKDIRDLRYKRNLVATVEIAPGEDFHDYINITVEELTKQIEDKLAAYYSLNEKIQTANNMVRTDADRCRWQIIHDCRSCC